MRILKESFNAGEFTPRLHSRYELAKYKNGCKTLTNFVPLAHGPVTRRPGTEYIAAVKTAGKYTRLIPFEFSEDDSYMLEFGHQYVRFYRNGGQIQAVDSDTKLLLHYDGNNNSTTITDDGDTGHSPAVVGDAKLKTTQKKFGSASLNCNVPADYVSVADHADWYMGTDRFTIDFWVRFKDAPSANGLFCNNAAPYDSNNVVECFISNGGTEIHFNSKSGGVSQWAITGTFGSALLADTWYHIAIIRGWTDVDTVIGITLNGALVSGSFTVVTGKEWPDLGGILGIGTFFLASAFIAVNGYIDEFRVTKGVTRWTAPFAPPTSQYPFGDGTGVIYEIATTYTEEDLPNLHFIQSADTMYIVHEKYVVRKLVRSGHTSWAISNVSFTGAPSEWSASDYPRAIEFYEDRLCFGGSPDQPDTIWMSDTGDYTTFTAPVTITGTTIAFVDSNPDTITDSGSGFITANFTAGLSIKVTGSTANNGTYTVANVTAGTLTLISTNTVTAEGASASITIDGGDADDDDSITLTFSARKVNDIQWLSSGRRLLAGTKGEEWWASGPSDTEPITPADNIAKRDSAWGSQRIMPVNIGDIVFYVQQNGKIVREMEYEFSKDKYISTDMNILAEHLTRDYSITAIAYQQHPYQILWCIRADGSLLALTYMKEHEVVGWSVHTTGSGEFESVAVIPGDPEDEVWFVVRRTVDGSTVRYIEKLKDFNFGSSLEDAFYVDSGLTYDGAAATVISGLDHLEGEAVDVLADGLVVTGHTVSSGAITLATAASKIHIGLAYTPELETLDFVAEDNEGTLQGVIKRITNIAIRLINSQGGLFGPNSDITDSIPYDSETSPFTGWTRDLSFDEGFDETATVYIKCDEPLPLEVAAILIDLEE